MGLWRAALGNVVARAAGDLAAIGSSAEDSLYPLGNVGLGQPDTPGRFAYQASGTFEAELDSSYLATSSARSDAPTGWADLLNRLASTPGLPANPPTWGSFFGRTQALEAFRPVYQDVDVLPGESFTLRAGIYIDAVGGSNVTAVAVRVKDLLSGREWNGSAWDDSGPAWTVVTTDAWQDNTTAIALDIPAQAERTTYRVIFANASPSYGASSHFYVADNQASGLGPGLIPDQDFAAVVGHNIPKGSTVEWRGSGGSPIWTLTPAQPSFYFSAGSVTVGQRLWQLRITPPSAALLEPPYVGELWAGIVTDLAWCPAFPFEMTRSDPGQARVVGGYGRQTVFSDARRDRARLRLNFEANEAGYEEARYFLQDATRHGTDPILLLPVDALEGAGAIYHGRLDDETTYIRGNLARRRYTLAFVEDPFPRI